MASGQLLKARGLTKGFGDVIALQSVDFDITSGEVHALLGENGAGKTTLMNILSGLYRADSGEILIDSKPVQVRSPREALDLGINCVHQHFQLIENFTVFENIVLGGTVFGGKKESIKRSEVAKVSEDYELEVDLDDMVRGLPMGQRQRVEILKALSRHPKILLFDEPTTNMVPQEVDALLQAMKKLVKEGIGLVFITHKIKDAISAANRITILRHGKNVGSFPISEATESKLVELMIGGKVESASLPSLNREAEGGKQEPVLQAAGVTLLDKKEGTLLKTITFDLYPSEILGVAGVAGNGQKQLVETLACIRKPSVGTVKILGRKATGMNSADAISLGLSYVPEDRIHDGILPRMTVAENLVLGYHRKEPYSKNTVLNEKEVEKIAKELIDKYKIMTSGTGAPALTLSGGNIQKLLVARALLSSPKVLVAHNPTRGLDVGTTSFFLKSLIALRTQGAGILFVCEDLDELISICDRIAVLFKGGLQGIVERNDFDRYKIGAMMLGQTGTSQRE